MTGRGNPNGTETLLVGETVTGVVVVAVTTVIPGLVVVTVVTGAVVVAVAAITDIPDAVVVVVVTGTSVYVCWFKVPEVIVNVVE
jgi:hypothetical protein